jgi:hypothetical protein
LGDVAQRSLARVPFPSEEASMFRRKFLAAAVAAAVACLVVPTTAEAGFKVRFTVGDQSIIVEDNGAGDYLDEFDNEILTGRMSPNGTPGAQAPLEFQGFKIALETVSTIHSDYVQIDSQTNFVVKYVGTGSGSPASQTLKIEIIADELSDPQPTGGTMVFTNTLNVTSFYNNNGQAGMGVGSVTSYADATPPGAVTDPITISNPTGGNGSETTYFTRASQYDLTQTIDLTLNLNNASRFDVVTSITPTPAPGGLILAATAVPFLVGLRRRFRSRSAAPTA